MITLRVVILAYDGDGITVKCLILCNTRYNSYYFIYCNYDNYVQVRGLYSIFNFISCQQITL